MRFRFAASLVLILFCAAGIANFVRPTLSTAPNAEILTSAVPWPSSFGRRVPISATTTSEFKVYSRCAKEWFLGDWVGVENPSDKERFRGDGTLSEDYGTPQTTVWTLNLSWAIPEDPSKEIEQVAKKLPHSNLASIRLPLPPDKTYLRIIDPEMDLPEFYALTPIDDCDTMKLLHFSNDEDSAELLVRKL